MRASLLLLAVLFPLSLYAEDKPATLTVQGEAVTKMAPDQATLPVTVQVENPDLKVAKQRHDERVRALLKLAESNGITKDEMQTDSTSIDPVYDYSQNSSHPALRGYQVQTTLNFTLTDIARLAQFMDGVIGAGIDTVGSVSYSLKNEDKVKEDTEVKAIDNAYSKASRFAAAAKVTLGKPVTIEEGNIEVFRPLPPRPMRMMAMAATAAPPPPQLPSGMVEVRQTVTVTYAIQ